MTGIAWVLIGLFLILEGVNRMGWRFNGDEMIKGILLALSGAFIVAEYL